MPDNKQQGNNQQGNNNQNNTQQNSGTLGQAPGINTLGGNQQGAVQKPAAQTPEDITMFEAMRQYITIGGAGMNMSGMMGMGDRSTWLAAVQSMGTWYSNNVQTYWGKSGPPYERNRAVCPGYAAEHIMCPLIGENVRDDCTGFIMSCLAFFCQKPYAYIKHTGIASADSAIAVSTVGGKAYNFFTSIGFQIMPFPGKEGLIAGDICYSPQHGTIYAGNGKLWDWGNVHYHGLPMNFFNHPYQITWRPVAPNPMGAPIDTKYNKKK